MILSPYCKHKVSANYRYHKQKTEGPCVFKTQNERDIETSYPLSRKRTHRSVVLIFVELQIGSS